MVVAHKILLSAPVPWIGDLGLGLDNLQLKDIDYSCTWEKMPNWMYPVVLEPNRPWIQRTLKSYFYHIFLFLPFFPLYVNVVFLVLSLDISYMYNQKV